MSWTKREKEWTYRLGKRPEESDEGFRSEGTRDGRSRRESRRGSWRSPSLRKGTGDGDSAGRRPRRAGPGAGPRSPGGGPCWRRLAPLRPSDQPHSSGFPTHSPSKRPQSPSFSRAPPPPLAGEAIFHPLLVFNLLWEKKAAFVERGAAQGAGRRRGRLCVPQLRANSGVGAAGVQAELGAAGEGGPGR